MAVAAETQNIQLPEYVFIDSFLGVAEARDAERIAARGILAQRKLNLEQGHDTTGLPVPIDALSTAHSVLDSAQIYGEKSPEHEERKKGLLLDCQRLVAEWYRKKKPEYFPPVRHIFDTETEEFFSHGLSVRQMTENALTPIKNDQEEEDRRVNERVEDATPQILRGLGKIAMGTQSIRTISECTDKAIADYASDLANGRQHTGYGGYVPEIEKLMIRDIKLHSQDNDRFEEQISLPGVLITHEIIQMALKMRQLEAGHMNKTELHGAQMLANDDLLDFARLLDDVAGQEWCTEVFMGEEVPKGFKKDYAGFRQEALRRQESLKDIAQTVAVFVLDLAEDNVDRRKAPAMVEDFVKSLLLKLAKEDILKDTNVAEQMFDLNTAQGLQRVARLEFAGEYQEAFNLMQKVEKAAPGGGYCSGGSCGLEEVNIHSKSGQELAKKLKFEAGDTVVKDKVRPCKCGRMSVVYAYNKSKVTKYCTGCHAFESKISKVTAKA